MRLVFLVGLLSAHVAINFAFNIDTQQPIVREGLNPSDEKLFGYSVHSYSNAAGNWILVGAPRDDTAGMKRFGALYRCRITKDAKCEPFRNVPDIVDKFDYIENKNKPGERVEDQWFGVSVTAKNNGIILGCAHRYIDFYNFQAYDPVGRCLVFNSTFDRQPTLAPCKDEVGGLYGFSYCQSGNAIAIHDDGKTVLVGNPGTFNWQGNAEIVDSSEYSANKYQRVTRTGRYSGATEFDYLAYSVSFGSFRILGNENEFAVGVPRYDEYVGRVVIFSYDIATKLSSVSASVTGFQVGAYFGHSLVVADLNQDGFDDLVVSAPYYTGLLRDQGRVYTYLNTQKSGFSLKRVLTGSLARGLFGYAIAVAGDVNQDGFLDIVIGAPFADDPTVYLYTTTPNGISDSPLQVISASSLNLNLSPSDLIGFGAALAGNVDLDDNGYPDIVVGAFRSEKAVVLRSKPVASIVATLSLDPQFLNFSSSTPFKAKLCMKYTGSISEANIDIDFDIEVDKNLLLPRAWFNGTDMKSSVSGSKVVQKDSSCVTFVLNLQSNIQNLITPIDVDVTYRRPPEPKFPPGDGNPQLSSLSSVLRSNAPQSLSESAFLLSGCRLTFICIPDLRIVSAVPTKNSVTLGQDSSVGLAVVVVNRDEPAYKARLRITFLKQLRQERILLNNKPILCANETTGADLITYICELGNPVANKQQVKVDVFVLLGSVSVTTPSFNFTVTATSVNAENSNTLKDNTLVSSPVGVVVRADFGIQGTSSPNQVPIDPLELSTAIPRHTEQVGQEVVHSYFVQNRGPSPIPETIVTVSWPLKTTDNRYLLYPLAVNIVGPGQCNAEEIGFINPADLTFPTASTRKKGERLTAPPTEEPSTEEPRPRRAVAQTAPCGAGKAYSFECTTFTCKISGLGSSDKVDITVVSKIYDFSLYQDKVYDLNLTSVAAIQFESVPSPVEVTGSLEKRISVTTFVINTATTVEKEPRKPWVIPVVVVASVLFLVLVIVIMVALGFFKRPAKDKLEEEKEELEQLNQGSKEGTAFEVNGEADA